jgi:hypothetical protein
MTRFASLFVLLFGSTCFADLKVEIDAKATNTVVVSGLVNPVLTEGIVTSDEASKPVVKTQSRKTMRVITNAKYVDLTIERLVVVNGAVERQRANVFSSSVANPFEFVVQGDGDYDVFVSAFDPGIQKYQTTIQLGLPKPPPDPDPPKPDPIPPITNGYNVGGVALKTAPSDPANAKLIATWYRTGASQLYGKGRLNDIERIKADIDKQFSLKQCRDQATCQQWDKWKSAVSAAFVAEQVKRKVFTREDWFASMIEVAEALEAVR